MSRVFILILIFIAIPLGLFVTRDTWQPLFTKNVQKTTKPSVRIDDHVFYVTLAKTDPEKLKGLSGRNMLPSDEGMLFLFDSPDFYAFWMKDMLFSLDMIFIKDNKIVTIIPDMQPSSKGVENPPIVKPVTPANKVLEINSGLSKKYNFKVGDTVTFSSL